MPTFTAGELARHLQGDIVGDPAAPLHGVADAATARPGDLVYAAESEYLAKAEASPATAILTSLDATSAKTIIRVRNGKVAFGKTLALFHPEPPPVPGIHPSAVIHAEACLDRSVQVGPFCVVGERTRIEPGAVLMAGAVVGADCVIGSESRLFPNVTLYDRTRLGARVRVHAGAVLGSDGYGYVFDGGAHCKVPQTGHLIIEDDVEIGANVTIDRGALGATRVGRGTKIDNLVHLAHNVSVGEHCLLVAQVGIAGSTKVGSYVTMAGQVGLADHLTIGNRVTIGAQAGVMNHIPDGQVWLGAPARPALQTKRQVVGLEKLPEALRRLSELERQVASLRAALPAATQPPS